MTYIAKPKLHHPTLPRTRSATRAATTKARSRRCARLRPRFDQRRDRPGVLGARHRAAPRRQALRHRLLVEDAGLFPRQLARLQQRARPHALGADRRQPRQPRPSIWASRATATRPRSASASSRTAIRRGVNMVYIVENNGVYGLTKGQFSATADKGSKSKRGIANIDEPLDLMAWRCCSARPTWPQLLRRQAAARAAHQGRDRAQGRGVHRRRSRRASRSTTTRARPRATSTCASTTRR